jgi:hypothetical protein
MNVSPVSDFEFRSFHIFFLDVLEMSQPKTGTEALLQWCKSRTANYAEVKIENFHLSWRDGLGFCALFHYYKPDEVGALRAFYCCCLCCLLSFASIILQQSTIPGVDYQKLKEMEPLKRLEIIFDIGDELGVANILDPEDMMIEPRPDMFSVITYLSQLSRLSIVCLFVCFFFF